MGKETKVGLAVIAVLMTVFGVLLFRHLHARNTPPKGSEVADAVKPLEASEPDVVKPEESRVTESKLWDIPTAEPEATEPDALADDAGAAPPASYMPRQDEDVYEPYESPAGDAYAQEAEASADLAAESPGHSPFQSGPALGATPEAAGGESQLPAGNPLRRTSAELPLEEEPVAEAPANDSLMTLPSEESPPSEASPEAYDPYAADAGSFEPTEPEFEQQADAAQPAFGSAPADAANAPAAMHDPFDAPAAAPASAPTPATQPQFGYDEPDDAFSESPVDAPEPQAFGAAEPLAAQPAAQQPAPAANPYDRFDTAGASSAAAADDWQEPAAAAPLAADAQQAEPLPLENGLYTVQPGDSLWTISEKVYGTGGYFKALAEHNRARLPRSDALTVGTQIAVPQVADLERDYPGLCPKQRQSAIVRASAAAPSTSPTGNGRDVYIVNEGDTLFDIARYELGKATRWAEIYQLNRDVLGEDFDYLRPGTELVMPPRETQQAAGRADSLRY